MTIKKIILIKEKIILAVIVFVILVFHKNKWYIKSIIEKNKEDELKKLKQNKKIIENNVKNIELKNKEQSSNIIIQNKNEMQIVKPLTSWVETSSHRKSSNSNNSSITNNNEIEKQHKINFVLNSMRAQKMIKAKEFAKKWCVWTGTSVKNNNEQQTKNMNK